MLTNRRFAALRNTPEAVLQRVDVQLAHDGYRIWIDGKLYRQQLAECEVAYHYREACASITPTN